MIKPFTKAKVIFIFWLCLAVVLIDGAYINTSLAKSPPSQQVPLYSRIFEQALSLAEQGDWQGSMKALSRIYETEVPVQAFYDTLERYKLEVLSQLADDAMLKTNKQSFGVGSLRQFFSEVLLPRPDRLYRDPKVDYELPFARLLQLYAVMGRDQINKSNNPLLEPAAPRVDLGQALASLDPWLVSAALFLARKGQGRIDPQDVVKRWRSRPDLWDQVCTHQALLYFASLTSAQFKQLRLPMDLTSEMTNRLMPIPSRQEPRASLLSYWGGSPLWDRDDYLKAVGCSDLQIARKQDEWQEYDALNPKNCRSGYLDLPAGWYSLRYLSDRAHGKTRPFNMQRGTLLRVIIMLRGQI